MYIYKIFNKINNIFKLIRVFINIYLINIIYIYFLLYYITMFEDKRYLINNIYHNIYHNRTTYFFNN